MTEESQPIQDDQQPEPILDSQVANESKEENKDEKPEEPPKEEPEVIPEKIKGLKATLLALLKKTKDDSRKSLYNHLKSIFVQIELTDPSSALDKFEEISYELRTKGSIEVPERFLNYYQLAMSSQTWVNSLREHCFQIKKAEGGEGGGEAAEPAALGYIPNFLNDSRILEWAGLGFGEELSYLLMKSLKSLAVKQSPRTVHFWGLLYGSKKDYYIAEGEKEAGGEPSAEAEARGTGVNRYVYWVTDSVTGEWTELPDAVPATINLARKLKKMFTGDIDAEVVTNPHFSKKEKDLLRAQIARISQITSLVPKGYFKKQEENERDIVEVPEEEKKLPTFEQLTSLDNWCHFSPNILKTGRTAHQQPEPPKEEPQGYDPAVALKELEIKDPYEPRLKPLSQDATSGSWKVPWTIKVIGDTQTYKEDYKETTFTNAIIMIKSYVWPGAYIFYQNNRWFNFYVGYGAKADQENYYPIVPPIPHSTPIEKSEYPEPNPKEGMENVVGEAVMSPQEALGKIEDTLNTPEKFEAYLSVMFDAIDVDQSGQIDKSEVGNFLKAVSKTLDIPGEPDPKAVEEFFKLFDKDDNEKISKEELAEPLKGLLTLWAAIIKESIPEAA